MHSVVSDEDKILIRRITGRRIWLFRLAALIFIPALLVLLLEFGLRLTGYGFQAKPIIKCEIKGRRAYCDNVKFSWLFFPPNIAREFTPFVIPAEKSQNSYRIFICGSSAAQGDPDGIYSFSRILDCLLSDRYPGINFEVINTAMTAINSHVVFRIVEDCAKYEPDLFVIYMGNNEVIGPYGAGTVFAPLSEHLSLIRLGIAFRGTKLGQLLTNLSYSVGFRKVPANWGGVEMFLGKQVASDDKTLHVVYKNYSRNLEDIIKIAQKSGASLILSSVASNLKDCPPFVSIHRTGLTENDQNNFVLLYKQARQFDNQGLFAQALEKYLNAADIDAQFAELQFCLGRCYYLLGQYDEAKQRFILARELDALRLRADNRINEIIKESAQIKDSPDIHFADAVEALDNQSSHQIPGSELFSDHVHLNFNGNYILAKSVFEQIEKILPDRIKSQKSSEPEIVDVNDCMQLLAYSDWDKYTIDQILLYRITKTPFTNRLFNDQQIEGLKNQIRALKDKLGKKVLLKIDTDYRRAIEKRPADWMLHWKYANFLKDVLNNYPASEEEFKKVLDFLPQSYWAHGMLGNLYEKTGNYDQALMHLNEAVKIKPCYAPLYYSLGCIYQRKQMNQLAEQNYKLSLRLNPQYYASYINLGSLLADDGRVDEAIKVCRDGLQLRPDFEDLHYNLGCFLRQDGQTEQAVMEFQTVLKINPAHKSAKQELDDILKEL